MQLLTPLDLAHPVEPMLDLAVRSARRLQADVHLLTVIAPGHDRGTFQAVSPNEAAASIPAADPTGGQIPYPSPRLTAAPLGTMIETRTQAAERALSTAHDWLDALVARFGDLSVKTVVLSDARPAQAIAAYAAQQKVDIVAMGSHARGGLRRTIIGSVAEEVVRSVSIPVLLAGPHYHADPRGDLTTLIVCVDGSDYAEAILPIAAWVRRLQMRVTIVAEASVGAADQLPGDVFEGNYPRRLAHDLQQQGVDATWEMLHGRDPAQAISAYAAALPGSVVAMVTHARAGLSRLLAGSVAMRVVHECPSPVLVLHPAGAEDRSSDL